MMDDEAKSAKEHSGARTTPVVTTVKRVGKYEVGKTIGEGEFSKVKLAINTETAEQVALKILSRQRIDKAAMDRLRKEVVILKKLHHKHVIQLKEVLSSQSRIYLVLEYATGGELFFKLANEGRFQERTARNYFRQVLSGISYCHSQGVCHRDLKPENLLLAGDGTLKITDFGLSALSETDDGDNKILRTTCGTPNYVAPEVLLKKGYDGKIADIWSCGCILFTFLAGFLPFNEPTTERLYTKIKAAEYTIPDWVSHPAAEVLRRILVPEPEKRITIDGILKLEWMEGAEVNIEGNLPEDDSEDDLDLAIEEIEEPPSNPNEPVGLRKANAFDLIARTGALNMRNLLRNSGSKIRTQRAPQRDPSALLDRTMFVSDADPLTIINEICAALKTYPLLHPRANELSFKIRVAGRLSAGVLTFTIQVFQLAPGLHLVEFVRGRGDSLEYFRLYKELSAKISHLATNAAKALQNKKEQEEDSGASSADEETPLSRSPRRSQGHEKEVEPTTPDSTQTKHSMPRKALTPRSKLW